jgi:chromosome segregation and condensation protein ScpB
LRLQNKSLAEVGAALGLEERTAQKRVARALEKLRKFFSKRGIALSVGAVAGAVSANSVQAAPAGLAASITTAALSGTAITTAAIVAATKTIETMTMTLIQKIAISTALVVSVGAGIFEARQNSQLRAHYTMLQQHNRRKPRTTPAWRQTPN